MQLLRFLTFLVASCPVGALVASPLEFVRTIEHPNFEEASQTGSLFGSSRLLGESLFIRDSQDDQAGPDAGAVYRFNLEGELQASFLNPDPFNGSLEFGLDTYVDGDDVYIGDWLNNTDGPASGVAYRFNSNGVLQDTFINPADEPARDGFGKRILRVGDDLWISAPAADSVRPFAGVIYVYDLA